MNDFENLQVAAGIQGSSSLAPALHINIIPANNYPSRKPRMAMPFKLVCSKHNGSVTESNVLVPVTPKKSDTARVPSQKTIKTAPKKSDDQPKMQENDGKEMEKPKRKRKKKWRWIYIKQLMPSKQLVVSTMPFKEMQKTSSAEKQLAKEAEEIEKRLLEFYPNTTFHSEGESDISW